jgi:hypothetical protein
MRSAAFMLATIRVNQFRSRAWRKPDVRPALRRVASFEGWSNHAGRHELVETAWTAAPVGGSGRNQFGHDPPMRRDRDALTCVNSADVATEIVCQLANAS